MAFADDDRSVGVYARGLTVKVSARKIAEADDAAAGPAECLIAEFGPTFCRSGQTIGRDGGVFACEIAQWQVAERRERAGGLNVRRVQPE